MNQILFVAGLLLSTVSFAALTPEEAFTLDLNDLQHEYSSCTAFYMISLEGLEKRGDPDPEAIASTTNTAVQSAELAAAIGKAIGMTEQAMHARMELEVQSQMEKMGRNYVNYSVLLKEFAYPCRDALLDPSAKLDAIKKKHGLE